MSSVRSIVTVLLLVASTTLASPIASRANVLQCTYQDAKNSITFDQAQAAKWLAGNITPSSVADDAKEAFNQVLRDCCAKNPDSDSAQRIAVPTTEQSGTDVDKSKNVPALKSNKVKAPQSGIAAPAAKQASDSSIGAPVKDNSDPVDGAMAEKAAADVSDPSKQVSGPKKSFRKGSSTASPLSGSVPAGEKAAADVAKPSEHASGSTEININLPSGLVSATEQASADIIEPSTQASDPKESNRLATSSGNDNTVPPSTTEKADANVTDPSEQAASNGSNDRVGKAAAKKLSSQTTKPSTIKPAKEASSVVSKAAPKPKATGQIGVPAAKNAAAQANKPVTENTGSGERKAEQTGNTNNSPAAGTSAKLEGDSRLARPEASAAETSGILVNGQCTCSS